jgi:hypothetical protein
MAMGTGARASSWPVVRWTRRGPRTASRRRGQKNLRPHEKQRRDSLGSPKNQAPRLRLGWGWGWPSEANWVWVGAVGGLPRRAWLLAGHPHMRCGRSPVVAPRRGGAHPSVIRSIRWWLLLLLAVMTQERSRGICVKGRAVAGELRFFRGAASFPPLNNRLTTHSPGLFHTRQT